MNKTNKWAKQNYGKIGGMEIRNILTGTRGEMGGKKGGEKRKGLVKEQVYMTHGHGQQGGDWVCEQGGGRTRGEQCGRTETTVIEQ